MSASPPIVIKKIVVPTDGSDCANRALRVAISVAKATSAQLTIVTVVSGIVSDASRAKAEKLVAAAESQAKASKVGVSSDVILEPLTPAGAIIEVAENEKADLIVMGTRGLGGFKRLVVGSVASAVVAHAPCAVLVVR